MATAEEHRTRFQEHHDSDCQTGYVDAEREYILWKIQEYPTGLREALNDPNLVSAETHKNLDWEKVPGNLDHGQLTQFARQLEQGVTEATASLTYDQDPLKRQETKALLSEKAGWELLSRSEHYPLDRPDAGLEGTARRIERSILPRIARFSEEGGAVSDVPDLLAHMNQEIKKFNEHGTIPSWYETGKDDPLRDEIPFDPVNHKVYYNSEWKDSLEDARDNWNLSAQNYANVCRELTGQPDLTSDWSPSPWDQSRRETLILQTIAIEQAAEAEHIMTQHGIVGVHSYESHYAISDWYSQGSAADNLNRLEALRDQVDHLKAAIVPEGDDIDWMPYTLSGDPTGHQPNTELLSDPEWLARAETARTQWAEAARNFADVALEATTDQGNWRTISSPELTYWTQLDALSEHLTLRYHSNLVDEDPYEDPDETLESINQIHDRLTALHWNTIDCGKQEDQKKIIAKEERKALSFEPMSATQWMRSVQQAN